MVISLLLGGTRLGDSPNEVAEPQHQDAYSSKLNRTGQISVKGFDKRRKHGCEGKRTETLSECGHRGRSDTSYLPPERPVERIVWVVARLRHKDFAMHTFDEMMATNVCHNLRARKKLHVELSLELSPLLCIVRIILAMRWVMVNYIVLELGDIHRGRSCVAVLELMQRQ